VGGVGHAHRGGSQRPCKISPPPCRRPGLIAAPWTPASLSLLPAMQTSPVPETARSTQTIPRCTLKRFAPRQNLWGNKIVYRKLERQTFEGEASVPDFAAFMLATGRSLPPLGPR
jgi:hypothetical protein